MNKHWVNDKGIFLFFEISYPLLIKPGFHNGKYHLRFWWLCFAFGLCKRPMHVMHHLAATGQTYWKES